MDAETASLAFGVALLVVAFVAAVSMMLASVVCNHLAHHNRSKTDAPHTPAQPASATAAGEWTPHFVPHAASARPAPGHGHELHTRYRVALRRPHVGPVKVCSRTLKPSFLTIETSSASVCPSTRSYSMTKDLTAARLSVSARILHSAPSQSNLRRSTFPPNR